MAISVGIGHSNCRAVRQRRPRASHLHRGQQLQLHHLPGIFWEMHDSLFGTTDSLSAGDIDKRAQSLGLDVAKLDGCVASDRFAEVIQRSSGEANKMQVSGTPTFLIGTLAPNGEIVNVKKTVVGAFPFDAFKAAIDPLLANAPVQR
jgi:protein-disulfide isomerase